MYTVKKLSKTMGLSNTEIVEAFRLSAEKQQHEEEEKIKREEAIANIQMQDIIKENMAYHDRYVNEINNRQKFLKNVKDTLLTECIHKLYLESCVSPLTKSDKMVARNIVSHFVLENGADNLLYNFKTKNLLLSEFNRIVISCYNKIVEACNEEQNKAPTERTKELIVPDSVKDDFYKVLSNIDCSDASKLIKDRVSDAIEEFIDTNTNNRLEYEDIINTAKEKMDLPKNEAFAEEISSMAKSRVKILKSTKPRSVYHYMVESLCKKSFKDKDLMTRYVNESNIDMESIVSDTEMIYTMLEMINTTEMIKIDSEFMQNYINSLK